jgi:hypothetical protein
MATFRNLRYCQVFHSSIYYDVLVGVNNLDEVNDVLQEWALTSNGPGEALDLPTELIINQNAEAVNLITKTLDENVYVKSATLGLLAAARSAGVSGTFPTLPKVLVGGLYVMPAATAYLWSTATFSGLFGNYTIATASFTLVENQVNYIGISYASGTPVYVLYTDQTSFNYSSIIPVCALLYFDSEINVVPFGQAGYGLAEKIIEVQEKRKEFEITSDFTLVSGSGTYVQLSVVNVSKGVSEIVCPAVNTVTADNDMWLWYKDSSSVWQKSENSQINNTQYQGAGTGLQSLGSGKFVINYLYRVIDDTNLLLFNILSGSFDSLAEAKDSDMLTDLPDAISEGAALVGRMIVEQGSVAPTVQKIQRVNPFKTVV